MEVATKFVQPFIPTLLSLILTSLSLPHDPLRFPPSSNNSPTLSPFLRLPPEVTRKNFRFPPFFPSLSFPLRTSSRCASFLPTVGKLALTRTTKECNQWETRFEGISRGISSGKGRCGRGSRIARSRNLLRQWRHLRWSSRRRCFPLPPLLPIILFHLFLVSFDPTISPLIIPNFIIKSDTQG